MMMGEKDFALKWGRLVAQAWTDPEFEERLFAVPAQVLAENGVHLPEELKCQVVTDGEQIKPGSGVFYLPYPTKPTNEELDDADLASVAGGIVVLYASDAGTALTSNYLVSRIKTLNPVIPTSLALP